MIKKFYIDSSHGYDSMLEQYESMHEEIGKARFLPAFTSYTGAVYDIKPAYGKGTIQVFRLLGNVMLIVYDFTFSEDIVTVFDLSKEYFEIEFCIAGNMYIQEEKTGSADFATNKLSISLSRDMKGTVRRCAGQSYQGVSITADKHALFAYFGSTGIGIWNDTIENLDPQLRSEYYLGQNASPEIANIFQQIWHCRLPVKSRILFYESKVMEALALIVSGEVTRSENTSIIGLTPYELEKIKEIPQLLLGQPFELPGLLALSEKLAVSPKRLTKGFKLVYGDTIFSYHRKFVLKKAAEMLLETENTISEIAYTAGYSSPSNFCAAFKKLYGVTPLKYRDSSLLHNVP